MSKVTRLPDWAIRVYRVASKKAVTMGDATTFCRANGVLPDPTLMIKLNPNIHRTR